MAEIKATLTPTGRRQLYNILRSSMPGLWSWSSAIRRSELRIVPLLSASMIKFGLTGIVNTLVGLGIIFSLKAWFGFSDTVANLVGYCAGFTVSCVLNARWTFQYRQALAPVVPGYALVVLIAYLANLGCVHFLIDVLHTNSYLAQAAGVVPYALITYYLSRRYVFRRRS